jgi:hypothetical protein
LNIDVTQDIFETNNLGLEEHVQAHIAAIPKRKINFEKSVRQRRAFMDNAHEILGDTSWIRKPQPPVVSLPTLMKNNGLQALNYIGLANVPKNDIERVLRGLSKKTLNSVRSSIVELKEKFASPGSFRDSAKWFSRIGCFRNIKRSSNKWYKPWTWNRYHYAIDNFAGHVIEKTNIVLTEKSNEERRLKQQVKSKIQLSEKNKIRECGPKINRFIKEVEKRSEDFLSIVLEKSHCFGMLTDSAKNYAENVNTSVQGHLKLASQFGQQNQFNVAHSLTEYSSKIVDIGKKTVCVISWIGKGSFEGVKELSKSLGVAVDRFMTDPVAFVKKTADSLHDVSISLGQVAISAVKNPRQFVSLATQLLSTVKKEFDNLPFEQKIFEASKFTTKLILSGLAGAQSVQVAGQYAGSLVKSAVLIKKELQLFKRIKAGSKKLVPSRLVQRLTMPFRIPVLRQKVLYKLPYQEGAEIFMSF